MSSFTQKFEKLGFVVPALIPMPDAATSPLLIASLERSGTSPPPPSPIVSEGEVYILDAVMLKCKLWTRINSEAAQGTRAPLLTSEEWSGWAAEVVNPGFGLLPRTRAVLDLAALGKTESAAGTRTRQAVTSPTGPLSPTPCTSPASLASSTSPPSLWRPLSTSYTSSDESDKSSQAGKLPAPASRRRRVAKFTI